MSTRRWFAAHSLIAGVVLVAVLLVALRLPSLFEPAWSADEGAYADVGRSLDLGAVLYSTVWDNKPPGIYWLAAAATLRGDSVLNMQLIALAAVGAGALAVLGAGRRLTTHPRALLAACIYVVFASLPLFEGDQLNTELVAAAISAVGVLLVVRGVQHRVRWAAAGGVALAIAALVDVRAAIDLAAALATPWLLIARGEYDSTRLRVRVSLAVLLAWACTLGLVAIPLAFGGSLPGLVDVLASKDIGYLAYFQSHAPFGTGVATPTNSGAVLAGATRFLGTLAVGGLLGALLVRRRSRGAAVVAWWLASDLAAVMVEARGFTHYAQLAAPALALAAAMLAGAGRRGRSPLRLAVAALCVLGTVPLAALALYVPPLTGALARGDPLPTTPVLHWTATGSYLVDGWQRIAGAEPAAAFDAGFTDDIYPKNSGLASLFDAHSAPGQPVFIWGGGTPWSYVLADRRSSSRFIWMGSAYGLYPGAQDLAVAELERTPPAVLVAESEPPSALLGYLRSAGYTEVPASAGMPAYWLAS